MGNEEESEENYKGVGANDFLLVDEEEIEENYDIDSGVYENLVADDVPTNGGEKPHVSQMFDNSDDAYNFYNCYALKEGFGVRRSKTNKSTVTREVIWRRFVCDKEGFKDLKDRRKVGREVQRRRDTRAGCMARMEISLKNGKWVVRAFEENHTHALTSPLKALKHKSHNTFHKKEVCQNLMTKLHGSGLGPSGIAKAINATVGNEVVSITSSQVGAHLRVQRRNNIGREGVLVAQYFQKRKSVDPNFYFAMELDNEGTLRSMFWADSRARNAYLNFGDVIVFDVTYKTNKFRMPFAPFTGVNHHWQSTLFGCALLADETKETFVWLFEQWLMCMFGKAPGAIITDMDGAMRNAISKVFPDTRHRFCSWHISMHLTEHVHELRDHNSEFAKDYFRWFNSKNVVDCEERWTNLVEKYEVEDKSWLGKMWNKRYHWVPAYLKETFVCGMTSSGRSESINAFFDGFVNSNTHLTEFVEQYEKALASRRATEEDEDFRTKNSKAVLFTRSTIEEHAGNCYTRRLFKSFQKEFKDSVDCWHKKVRPKDGTITRYSVGLSDEEERKWCIVVYDESDMGNVKCECSKFETEGLLCKHILHIMTKKHLTTIPERYILKRWTMDARYQVGSGVSASKEDDDNVTPFMNWCLLAKVHKLLDEAASSSALHRKLNVTFDAYLSELAESSKGKNFAIDDVGSQIDSTRHATTIEALSSIPEISINDPHYAKTKGRPKVATRIPFGIEAAEEQTKKRKCSICGERGHYATTCLKKTKV